MAANQTNKAKDSIQIQENEAALSPTELQYSSQTQESSNTKFNMFSRDRYTGSLLFNTAAFLLPALYATLSKLWVANIDPNMVATTDAYTYMGVVVEVLNEGLPRAAWSVIGDKSNRTHSSRLGLSYTLITFQALLGLLMSIAFLIAASSVANAFVPPETRASSITYVRLSAFSTLASAIETAVAVCTRSLDKPDIPLIISTVKFAVNILLDMLILSKFHIPQVNPTINTQALTQLICNLVASIVGLAYFLYITLRHPKPSNNFLHPSPSHLKTLARPGLLTFMESALRNALYLWLVAGIVSLGQTYATAWGIFNTIRWGLVMVPVQALEATTLTFVGHAWGRFRAEMGQGEGPDASWMQVKRILRFVGVSCVVVVVVEVPLCLGLSFRGAEAFAGYLAGDQEVAAVTGRMWRTVDWCYIFYGLSTQMAALLLATRPRWYLYQSVVSNLCWVLPWAIVVTKVDITPENAWTYHSIVFGGSLVFSFFDILAVDSIWVWTLLRGKMSLRGVW